MVGKKVRTFFEVGWLGVTLSDAARSFFSPDQQKILTYVYNHGGGDLYVTSINRTGRESSYHHTSKKQAIDFGCNNPGRGCANRYLLWRTFWNLKNIFWSGGLGVGNIGNPHLHVDTGLRRSSRTGKTYSYYFVELSNDGQASQEISQVPAWRLAKIREYYTGKKAPFSFEEAAKKTLGFLLLGAGALFLYHQSKWHGVATRHAPKRRKEDGRFTNH